MKKIIFIMAFLLMFSGCADKRLILVPQSEYYPTFPTTDFQKSEKHKIDMWIETEDVNGTTKTYLVAEKTPMMSFIRDTKELRSNYNLLLKKINEFNAKIKEQNRIQNEKKPTEVESINNSWFK
jgi:hypothetical protein